MEWDDLSDDELLGRLRRRGVSYDEAVRLVWRRENVDERFEIDRILAR